MTPDHDDDNEYDDEYDQAVLTARDIDRLVYELYGVIEEETGLRRSSAEASEGYGGQVRIVEEATGGK